MWFVHDFALLVTGGRRLGVCRAHVTDLRLMKKGNIRTSSEICANLIKTLLKQQVMIFPWRERGAWILGVNPHKWGISGGDWGKGRDGGAALLVAADVGQEGRWHRRQSSRRGR